MLVIRRRAGEAVQIGADIEIQIIEVSPNRVKLGISAPRDIPVARKEAHLTRERNLASAQGGSPAAVASFLENLRIPSKI